MKRALCVAILGVVAVTTLPANATEKYGVVVDQDVSQDGVFVGVGYTQDNGSGERYTPVGGASVNLLTGTACAGLSYQVPQCVGGPIG